MGLRGYEFNSKNKFSCKTAIRLIVDFMVFDKAAMVTWADLQISPLQILFKIPWAYSGHAGATAESYLSIGMRTFRRRYPPLAPSAKELVDLDFLRVNGTKASKVNNAAFAPGNI